jgi:hypothetical protein
MEFVYHNNQIDLPCLEILSNQTSTPGRFSFTETMTLMDKKPKITGGSVVEIETINGTPRYRLGGLNL